MLNFSQTFPAMAEKTSNNLGNKFFAAPVYSTNTYIHTYTGSDIVLRYCGTDETATKSKAHSKPHVRPAYPKQCVLPLEHLPFLYAVVQAKCHKTAIITAKIKWEISRVC